MENSNIVALSAFARTRHRPDQPFSHFAISEEELLARVGARLSQAKPGYREGVVLVPVDPAGFYTSTVALKEGDVLRGSYKPRRAGEAPRKQVGVVGGQKMPAAAVDVVLYRRDVLLEDEDANSLTGADWEIVSINARPTLEEEPMTVGTLLANHFHVQGSDDGGTSTGMTADELVEALRVSYAYWRDKARVAE